MTIIIRLKIQNRNIKKKDNKQDRTTIKCGKSIQGGTIVKRVIYRYRCGCDAEIRAAGKGEKTKNKMKRGKYNSYK